jgi:Protein of unknown function (DUF2975)
MKKNSTIILQIVIVLVAIGTLVFMFWEPTAEGRNVGAALFDIYFKDPFLAYMYIASIPFFVALYQAFKVLGYAGENRGFSQSAVNALRTIKYCGISLVGFLLGAEAYLFVAMRGKDDIAGGVMMGLMMIVGSALIATTAARFERKGYQQ